AIATAFTATAPTGARLVSITVPGGTSVAAERWRPSSVMQRSVRETNNPVVPAVISFGVSQGMSPSQYSSIEVLGVPPLSTRTITSSSGSGSRVVRCQWLGHSRYGSVIDELPQDAERRRRCLIHVPESRDDLRELGRQFASIPSDLRALREADVASGNQGVLVRTDVTECDGPGKARNVYVGTRTVAAPPGVVCAGDAPDIGVRQLAMDSIHHATQLPPVDEERLSGPVAEALALLVARQEPEAGGDLGRVEELAPQRHHAVDGNGLDEVLADLARAGLVGRHRAARQHQA